MLVPVSNIAFQSILPVPSKYNLIPNYTIFSFSVPCYKMLPRGWYTSRSWLLSSSDVFPCVYKLSYVLWCKYSVHSLLYIWIWIPLWRSDIKPCHILCYCFSQSLVSLYILFLSLLYFVTYLMLGSQISGFPL